MKYILILVFAVGGITVFITTPKKIKEDGSLPVFPVPNERYLKIEPFGDKNDPFAHWDTVTVHEIRNNYVKYSEVYKGVRIYYSKPSKYFKEEIKPIPK